MESEEPTTSTSIEEIDSTQRDEIPEEPNSKKRKKLTRRNSLLETVPVEPHSVLSGNIEEVHRLIVEAAARAPSADAKELIIENYSLIQGNYPSWELIYKNLYCWHSITIQKRTVFC